MRRSRNLYSFAQLLEHLALGDLGGFLLGNRLMEIGIEGFAAGVHLFEP